MAQERFADMVDRFTRGDERAAVSPAAAKEWQEQVDRTMARVQWEPLAGDVRDEGATQPLAVSTATSWRPCSAWRP